MSTNVIYIFSDLSCNKLETLEPNMFAELSNLETL